MNIINGKIFNGIEFINEKNIEIQYDKITDISNIIEINENTINAEGLYVVPGFVDIHTHGINGYNMNQVNDEECKKAIMSYIKNGTTSFLPSTVSQDISKTLHLLELVKSGTFHKAMFGVHLEAPYINRDKLGAQNREFIEKPDAASFNELYSQYYNQIKRVTVAPELDENFGLIKHLNEHHILVSFGHTLCDSKTASGAFDAGVKLATHYMNAMPQIHHREVSITGKALLRDDVYIELISDLHHVCEDIIHLMIKIKPVDKIIIVSDSMSAACLCDGIYELSGNKVIVKDHTARLVEGNLAGSLITMLDGVKNHVKIGVPIEKALRFATANPAVILGMEDKIGMLKCGNDADILLLDQDLNIKKVISKGIEL